MNPKFHTPAVQARCLALHCPFRISLNVLWSHPQASTPKPLTQPTQEDLVPSAPSLKTVYTVRNSLGASRFRLSHPPSSFLYTRFSVSLVHISPQISVRAATSFPSVLTESALAPKSLGRPKIRNPSQPALIVASRKHNRSLCSQPQRLGNSGGSTPAHPHPTLSSNSTSCSIDTGQGRPRPHLQVLDVGLPGLSCHPETEIPPIIQTVSPFEFVSTQASFIAAVDSAKPAASICEFLPLRGRPDSIVVAATCRRLVADADRQEY